MTKLLSNLRPGFQSLFNRVMDSQVRLSENLKHSDEKRKLKDKENRNFKKVQRLQKDLRQVSRERDHIAIFHSDTCLWSIDDLFYRYFQIRMRFRHVWRIREMKLELTKLCSKNPKYFSQQY